MYKIGEKEFELKPLVLGQWQQLLNLNVEMDDIFIDGEDGSEDIDGDSLVKKMFEVVDIPMFLAIILTEKDKGLMNKNVEDLAKYIKWNIEPDVAGGIVTDFLDINPLAMINEKFMKGSIGATQILKALH